MITVHTERIYCVIINKDVTSFMSLQSLENQTSGHCVLKGALFSEARNPLPEIMGRR